MVFKILRLVQHLVIFISSTPNEVAVFPPFLSPSFSLSLCISPFTLDHHTRPVKSRRDYSGHPLMTTTPRPNDPKASHARNSTDDAFCVAAIQWEKIRATDEMGSVPGLSPTRSSWGKCCYSTALSVPVVVVLIQLCAAFNLDAEKRVVFSGPRGSYFGYSVEFFSNSSR